MSKPLIYLDQNIIGLQLNEFLKLKKREDLVWVYSKDHFDEIARSDDSRKYLEVLDDIGAKMLELNLNENWQITGAATLHEHGTAVSHFEDYLEAIGDVDFDDTLFDSFQVWINGGGDEGPLRDISENLAEQVLSLTSDIPYDTTELEDKTASIQTEFDEMVEEMISNGNDITKTREAFGDKKGTIGSIKGEKQVERIWEIISPTMGEHQVSCDQFFGFDPIDSQGYDSWPIYLGIVSCCAVMDILGFQAEKKCRKINKIQNVRSDANHIAMGAFCSAIMSEDKRLVSRAKAIYEYKGIGTLPLLVQRKVSNGN